MFAVDAHLQLWIEPLDLPTTHAISTCLGKATSLKFIAEADYTLLNEHAQNYPTSSILLQLY
jgi:hypothetical protein